MLQSTHSPRKITINDLNEAVKEERERGEQIQQGRDAVHNARHSMKRSKGLFFALALLLFFWFFLSIFGITFFQRNIINTTYCFVSCTFLVIIFGLIIGSLCAAKANHDHAQNQAACSCCCIRMYRYCQVIFEVLQVALALLMDILGMVGWKDIDDVIGTIFFVICCVLCCIILIIIWKIYAAFEVVLKLKRRQLEENTIKTKQQRSNALVQE